MTTPIEARKLDMEYKNNLKIIKEILVKCESKEEAMKNPVYMQLKRINKTKLDRYFELVEQFQIEHGFGKFGDPESKHFVGKKKKKKK